MNMFDIKPIFEFKRVGPPQYNEPFMVPRTSIITHPTKYADMDYWLERTPEMVGIISAITDDVIGDGFTFEGGKQAVNKADKFSKRSFLKEELKKAVFDWAYYGDGYLWKGSFNQSTLGTMEEKVRSRLPEAYKHIDIKALIDEDSLLSIKHVPTSTMNIDVNKEKTAVAGFRQVISGNSEPTNFTPKEVIHAKFLTVKGKIYGFSPAQAMLPEMQMIGYIKDYAATFFSRGGYPDMIFNFPKEPPNSAHVRGTEQRLQKYEDPREKHGHMVITGELNLERLNEFNKDMEFRQLAVYVTGVMAMGYKLPMSRVANIIGGVVKATTGTDDLANESYWASISNYQDYWETLLNTQIFEEMGATFRFNRGYKQNEVRETMTMLQKLDSLQKMRSLGVEFEVEMVKHMFPHLQSYIKGMKSEEEMMQQQMQIGAGYPGNRQGSTNGLDKGAGSAARSKQKRSETDSSSRDRKELGV